MITEDYVSFEVAKLLKEKGFEPPHDYRKCIPIMYTDNGEIKWGVWSDDWYPRITLQMARKWLIENYNIHIEVRYFPTPNIYRYVIIHSPATFENIDSHPQYFNKDEEACEAGIRYCLENLI